MYFCTKKNEERNINTIGYNEFISTNKEFVYMLPTIIEKTQPISGATVSSPSNPGLVPYIPAGADGYLHTSGEFKPISETYTKNELEKIATHASMPVSDRTKYTTYPVTMVNGSLNNFHTAPANGYVRIIIDPANSNSSSGIILITYVASTTEDDITAMLNGTSMIEKEILAESTIVTNIRHRLFVPIEKGNKFMVWFNNPDNIQILDYSFIPCNGSL